MTPKLMVVVLGLLMLAGVVRLVERVDVLIFQPNQLQESLFGHIVAGPTQLRGYSGSRGGTGDSAQSWTFRLSSLEAEKLGKECRKPGSLPDHALGVCSLAVQRAPHKERTASLDGKLLTIADITF